MGTTPYNLVYGIEVIMPLELEIPTLQIYLQDLIDHTTYKEQILHQLEMLNEKCINTLEHLQDYIKKLQRKQNNQVIP